MRILFTNSSQPIAIFVFSDFSSNNAIAISKLWDNATIYATKRVQQRGFTIVDSIEEAMVDAFKAGHPIIAFCACGIVIRILASELNDKYREPPVLCISEDGLSIVPLLGSNNGANDFACQLAEILHGYAAITTSGYLRFGINLLDPPADLELFNKNDAAHFISSLLSGEKVQFIGDHDWISSSRLPFSANSSLKIIIDDDNHRTGSATTLVYRRCKQSGVLTIIGLGPGNKESVTFSARSTLIEATDVFGYDYYIKLALPFLSFQTLHPSDNRQELQRAQQALDLAATGKNVAMISSGDPGIFAMASAIFEIMEKDYSKKWDNVKVKVEPGITAAQSAAARFGAPLGHDFAVISLSDNLKPWSIIEKRLKAALQSDMVLALYNPVSRSRPTKILEVLDILKRHCTPERIIMIGTDIGRTGEHTTITTLAKIDVNDITSRSVIIVGSSKTRKFSRAGKLWSYTPRSYASDQEP